MAEMPASPILPSHKQVLDDVVTAQQESLLNVLQPISNRLGDAITAQQSMLDVVTGTLKDSLKYKTRNQGKAIQHIGDQIIAPLQNRVTEQQVRMSPIAEALKPVIASLPFGAIDPETGMPFSWGHNPLAFTGHPAGPAVRTSPAYQTVVDIWESPGMSGGGYASPCWVPHGSPGPSGGVFLGTVPYAALSNPESGLFGVARCYGLTHQSPPISAGGKPPLPKPVSATCPAEIVVNVPPCPSEKPDADNADKNKNAPCDQCVKCDDIKDLPGYKVYQIPVDKKNADSCYLDSQCGEAYWYDKAANIFNASIADAFDRDDWQAAFTPDGQGVAMAQANFLIAEDDAIDSMLAQLNY